MPVGDHNMFRVRWNSNGFVDRELNFLALHSQSGFARDEFCGGFDSVGMSELFAGIDSDRYHRFDLSVHRYLHDDSASMRAQRWIKASVSRLCRRRQSERFIPIGHSLSESDTSLFQTVVVATGVDPSALRFDARYEEVILISHAINNIDKSLRRWFHL